MCFLILSYSENHLPKNVSSRSKKRKKLFIQQRKPTTQAARTPEGLSPSGRQQWSDASRPHEKRRIPETTETSPPERTTPQNGKFRGREVGMRSRSQKRPQHFSSEPTHAKLESDCLRMVSLKPEFTYSRISAASPATWTSSFILLVGPLGAAFPLSKFKA